MDKNKQQLKIPGFAIAIAVIFVVSLLFLIFVFMKFTGSIDTYNRDHASATSQISVYQDYLNRKTEVEEKIAKMKAEFEAKSATLTVNPRSTLDDIRNMLVNLGYDLSTLSVGAPSPDGAGRMSATGDPLYVTNISYNFTTTEEKMLETIRYFEDESDGSYFISGITLSDNTTDGGEKLYTVGMTISLYYFNSEENMGLPATATAESSAAES